jgi:exopolysaccharide/PEP-CTERM locus tyrosine autokinase
MMAIRRKRDAAGSLIERAAEVYDFGMASSYAAPLVTADSEARAVRPAPPPLPKIDPSKLVKVDRELLRSSGFIVPGAPPTSLSEEFRLIKRQLLLSALGGPGGSAIERGQLILICSAQPNEGKTFSSVNLALSMASETEIEVVLVDADVAKPEILSTLGLPGGPGLMDALANPALDVEELLIHTDIPNLSVLPAGLQTNNDTELLASDRTGKLINRLIENKPRRIILFDSAPALAASPASVLALHVGQCVIVVRADQTTESALRDTMSLLDACPRLQFMLNGVSYSGTNRKFGSYYGFGE